MIITHVFPEVRRESAAICFNCLSCAIKHFLIELHCSFANSKTPPISLKQLPFVYVVRQLGSSRSSFIFTLKIQAHRRFALAAALFKPQCGSIRGQCTSV